MADDFNNLRDFKKLLFQNASSNIDLKQTRSCSFPKRIRLVITKNSTKNNDLSYVEKLNQLNRVYH